jgi:hypothetical protein
MKQTARKSHYMFKWCPQCQIFDCCYGDGEVPKALDPTCAYGPFEDDEPEECYRCEWFQTVADYPAGPEFGPEHIYDDCVLPAEKMCPYHVR